VSTTSPAPWAGTRIARPARDLDRSSVFYRELLGLSVRGGFSAHDGYDGVFFALPGGGELELTAGPAEPRPGTAEDLLVFYVDTADDVRATGERLVAAGVTTVEAENPYWTRFGRTFLDPDGYRIVIAARDESPADDVAVQISWHDGPRAELRALFELAEDSELNLDAYLDLGRVLVARRGTVVLGHLQLVQTTRPGEIELKNMAVLPEHQGTGVGRALVETALADCRAEGSTRMVVATAAADAGNLRFYQRVGFRLVSIDHDAFTPATGYPDPILIDGIPLLDRVWLAQDLVRS
jgi:GNAT superfamily N-acetyltransferase